ncbi:MAG: GNAT family N-acetyltransferase [Sphaerochaetaceae bacterium]|jgi:GNAT superfamily N-acetyltransferase|nr:GNAT family N-acetyltransferase [Sphaerochaetaceae bacterium]
MIERIEEQVNMAWAALRDYDEDPRVFQDIMTTIQGGHCKLLMALDRSVLIGLSDGLWYLVANDEQGVLEAVAAIKALPPLSEEGCLICAKQDIGLDLIEKAFGIKAGTVCIAHGLYPQKVVDIDLPEGFEFRNLELDSLDFVMEHYHLHPSREYIQWRIESKELWGAWVKGELIGFIGLHGERTMGMLEILPEYRRKGYARALETCLANHLVKSGIIPFCHIFVDNPASLELHRKMGYTAFRRRLCWLE